MLKELVEKKYDDYARLSSDREKTTFYADFQRHERLVHSKYWKQEQGEWVEMTNPKEIHNFISTKFRNITKAKKRRAETKQREPKGKRPRTNGGILDPNKFVKDNSNFNYDEFKNGFFQRLQAAFSVVVGEPSTEINKQLSPS